LTATLTLHKSIGYRAAMSDPPLDQRLLDATISVLAETGWEGVTLERVAEEAGRSRVTLWRQGVTQDVLLGALLDSLADDFRDSMWPVLTAEGSGRDRLVKGISVLCAVIDRHLPLVLASDTVFHQGDPGTHQIDYLDPFVQFVREGRADGSLRTGGPGAPSAKVDDVAQIVFNSVAWTYTHMRGRHEWSPARSRRLLVDLVLRGIADV
jgi:AcrR family transcriptional regulator